MDMQHELKAFAGNMIYLKPIAISDLPDDVEIDAGSLETVYSVFNTSGEQVALVANADIASALAEQNDMQVVSLH